MEIGGEIEDEVTRTEAVRYLQGALGHAVGSILFLLLGGLLWVVEYTLLAFVSIAVVFLLSANGLSIWAWDRLRTYFAARTAHPGETDLTRTLVASPLSVESRVEIKAGAVMTLVFIGLLVLGRFALELLGVRPFGYLLVGVLGGGNIAALAKALHEPPA